MKCQKFCSNNIIIKIIIRCITYTYERERPTFVSNGIQLGSCGVKNATFLFFYTLSSFSFLSFSFFSFSLSLSGNFCINRMIKKKFLISFQSSAATNKSNNNNNINNINNNNTYIVAKSTQTEVSRGNDCSNNNLGEKSMFSSRSSSCSIY